MHGCRVFYIVFDVCGNLISLTFLGSVFATGLSEIWYGLGVLLGAFAGWSIAYARLRYVEKNLDRDTFCRWQLLDRGKGKMPSGVVYQKDDGGQKGKRGGGRWKQAES